jgi:cysteine desulfurase
VALLELKMTVKTPVYMDYHATTPLDPRALDAMMPYLRDQFGNAASLSHAFGWQAEKAVEHSRAVIAAFLGAEPKEIIFTSGATESNNIALKGALEVYKEKGGHIVTQVTEHKSVLDTCKYLEKQGAHVTYLEVDALGLVNPEDVRKAVTAETVMISIMAANNEIGTVQPVAEIGKIAREKNVLFHVDAAQGGGRLDLNVNALNIDVLSLSAHKMYGPKGIGILYVRSKNPHVRLAPVIHGGGHEQGLRSGTLNVPAIVGFAAACGVAKKEMAQENARLDKLRNRLRDTIQRGLEDTAVNGHPDQRLANNLNMSFSGIEGEALMSGLQSDVAVSAGSACTSKSVEPSYVLRALGLPGERIHSSIRFGLGRFTTEEEVDFVAARVIATVKKLRDMSPFYSKSKE